VQLQQGQRHMYVVERRPVAPHELVKLPDAGAPLDAPRNDGRVQPMAPWRGCTACSRSSRRVLDRRRGRGRGGRLGWGGGLWWRGLDRHRPRWSQGSLWAGGRITLFMSTVVSCCSRGVRVLRVARLQEMWGAHSSRKRGAHTSSDAQQGAPDRLGPLIPGKSQTCVTSRLRAHGRRNSLGGKGLQHGRMQCHTIDDGLCPRRTVVVVQEECKRVKSLIRATMAVGSRYAAHLGRGPPQAAGLPAPCLVVTSAITMGILSTATALHLRWFNAACALLLHLLHLREQSR
jgi:hypothetical protein